MVKKFSLKQLLILFSTLLLLSSSLILVSCNSGADSYSDPTSSYLKSEDTLISVAQLKEWYDNGMKTEEGYPVLVIEIIERQPTDYDNDSKNTPDYIPGSVVRSFLDLQETRSDGPVNNTSMVASGSKMDSIISNLGIEEDTVIVFTGQPGYQITRAWWTFYYWGFPESKIKVLDGGTPAWIDAGYPTTNNQKIVTPSGFKISDLPYPEARVKRVDEARVPIGKMIDYAKNGGAMILATVPGTGQGFFDGKIKGAYRVFEIYTNGDFFKADKTFKDPEDIKSSFAEKGAPLPEDKDARIVVYCNKANLASLYYYVLKEVLGYNNVGNYDGAWSEWAGLFYDNETGLGTVVEGSKYNALALTEEVSMRDDAFDLTAINNYIYTNNLDPSYDGDGNEINEEDKDYILNGGAGGLPGEAIGGGGSMGGC